METCLFMYINKEFGITITNLIKNSSSLKLLAFVIIISIPAKMFAQSGFCNDSEPFCTADILTFPAGVNTGEAENGPEYDCLYTQPNPAWYHMKIAVPGDLNIKISSNPQYDIDFICWGPFSDPHAPCGNQLTLEKVVDCSYDAGYDPEYCLIENAQINEYYILLITNYSNNPCAITFEKTGGSGETDCNIVPSAASNNGPLCEGETLELYAEPVNYASYSWTGPNGFTSNEQNPLIPNAQLSNAGIYNLIVTLGGESSDPFPTEVFIYANPVADFDYDNVCEGSEIQFTDLSTCASSETPIISWQWDFGDGNSSGLQNPTHTYAAGGDLSYEVSLTVETSGGCFNTISNTIYIYPKPVALFDYSFIDGSSCINSEIQFNDQSSSSQSDIISWNWDFGDFQTSTEQNPTHIYNTSGTYTVILTIENENGCDSSYQTDIIIYSDPIIDFSFTEVCFGNTTEFNDSDHINMGATSEWLYDFGDGNTANESDPTHLYSAADNYEVTFSIIDTNGCSNSITHTVPVFESPMADFSYDSVCLYSTTHLTDLSEPEGSIDYWIWDLGDGNSSNQQNVNHIYSNPGVFDVQLIAGNNEGCSDTINHSLQVWEPPVANFIYSDTSCTEGLIYFNDSSYSNESSISELLWYFPNGHMSTEPNTYFVFLNSEIFYNVSLYIEDARGCSDTITKEIYIEPEFQVNFLADTVCFGDKTNLGVYIVKPQDDSIVQNTWSFRDGSPQITTPNDSIMHIFTEPGSFEVMLQSQNIDGCLDVVRKNVKVRSNPEAHFSFTESYCNDSSWFYDETTEAEGSINYWRWKYGDGAILEINAPENPDHFHFYPPQYQSYISSLFVQDNFGCRDSIQQEINHYPCVLVNYFLDTNWICNNVPAIFIDSSIVDPDYEITRKTWFFGDGESLQVDPNTDTIFYQYNHYGTYQSKLLVEYQINDLLVKDSSEKILEILESPKANFNIEEVCQGEESVFENITQVTEIELKQLFWTFGDGQDTIYDYINGQNEINHLYAQDTLFTAKLWVIAQNNCKDSIQHNTRINSIPEIGFYADTTIFCGDAEVIFRDTSSINHGEIASRLWTFGDGDFMSSDADTALHHYSNGIYTVSLETTSDKFCKSTLNLEDYILINPTVEADFDIDPREISISNKNDLEVINYVNDETYINWSLSDTIHWENLYVPNLADSIYDTGTYHLKQYTINKYGCQDSVSVKFVITPAYSFYVPDAFSPNNNGVNDTWGPVGKYFDLKSYDLKIFSRWGKIIFQTQDFYQQWDGRLQDGSAAPIGSYAYIIRLQDMDGNYKLMKGSIILLL